MAACHSKHPAQFITSSDVVCVRRSASVATGSGRQQARPGPHATESGRKFGHKNRMTLRKSLSAIERCALLIRPTGKICSIFLTIASDIGLFRCQIECA
jgi:hypothetical protein